MNAKRLAQHDARSIPSFDFAGDPADVFHRRICGVTSIKYRNRENEWRIGNMPARFWAWLFFASILSVGAFAQSQNYAPYNNLLAQKCGAKHLEWISPADLNDLIADFHDSLGPAQKIAVDRANTAKIMCKDVIAGATCDNVAALKAMRKTGVLIQFARKLCASGAICRGQSMCSLP